MTNIEDSLKALAEHIHKNMIVYVPQIGKRYPFNHVDNGVIRVAKIDGGYRCYFSDQYFIGFTSGRFGPGVDYKRDERILSDTQIVSSFTQDYPNGGDVPQDISRHVKQSHTKTKEVSVENLFRVLVGANVGVEVKAVSAGVHTEFEFSTTSTETNTESLTNETDTTIPIHVPAHSTMRYTETVEKSTYRQTIRAKGVMDWTVGVSVYHAWGHQWESLNDLVDMFTGKVDLNFRPFDPAVRIYEIFKTNPRPEAECAISDEMRTMALEMTLRTHESTSGITKIEPVN